MTRWPCPIVDPADLARLVDAARDADVLALDTEGDGFHRYRARLCTIQLAWARLPGEADRGAEHPGADDAVVIDPLADLDLAALAPLLGADGPLKLIHDLTFDVKMLATRGLRLERVYDTAAAARLLGEPSTGLAALVEAHLGVDLDKGDQLADWAERPLPAARLAYLLDDVRHLPGLHRALEHEAQEQDLEDEVAVEMAYVLERAGSAEATRPPWTKLPGIRDLSAEEQAVARALANLRERIAEERDVPPHRVLSHRALIAVARRRPPDPDALSRVRGARRMPVRAVLEAVEEGRAAGEPPPREAAVLSPPAPPPEVRADRKAREKRLRTWRTEEAERRGVTAHAVLPAHCLRELAREAPEGVQGLRAVPGLGARRLERYGERLLAVLAQASGEPGV